MTLVGSLLIALIAGFVRSNYVFELANTGVLTSFFIAFIGLIVLRRIAPDLPRKFRFPLIYVLAPVGILVCFYMILTLSQPTQITFLVLMLLGLVFYMVYAVKHRCWDSAENDDS